MKNLRPCLDPAIMAPYQPSFLSSLFHFFGCHGHEYAFFGNHSHMKIPLVWRSFGNYHPSMMCPVGSRMALLGPKMAGLLICQCSPKGSQMAPNSQYNMVLIMGPFSSQMIKKCYISDHLGPLGPHWHIRMPAMFGHFWSQKGHFGPPVHIIGGWRNCFKPTSYMPRDYSYAMSNKHINGCDQKSEGISSKINKNCKILLSNATQWQGHDMGCDYLSILLGDEVVCQLWPIPNT